MTHYKNNNQINEELNDNLRNIYYYEKSFYRDQGQIYGVLPDIEIKNTSVPVGSADLKYCFN